MYKNERIWLVFMETGHSERFNDFEISVFHIEKQSKIRMKDLWVMWLLSSEKSLLYME